MPDSGPALTPVRRRGYGAPAVSRSQRSGAVQQCRRNSSWVSTRADQATCFKNKLVSDDLPGSL